jgi:hypothetical protein
MTPLDDTERRALRKKARAATLDALTALGGEARREAIRAWALAHGSFTEREAGAPPPAGSELKYASFVDHDLSWALTDLKRDGLVENPMRSVWRATAAAAAAPAKATGEAVGAERLAELRAMPYRNYLRTPEWRKTRAAALLRAGTSCSLDATHTDGLEVHHRTYGRVGAELASDLVVLCHHCHQLHHEEYGLARRDKPVARARRRPWRRDKPALSTAATGKHQKRSVLSARTKRRLGKGLRELVVRAGAIAGLIGGFAWAVHHQVATPKCHIPAARGPQHAGGGHISVLGGCLGSGLSHVLLAWLVPIAVGGVLGTLVALPLVTSIRLGRRPAR